MNIAVIGAGAWGTALAIHFAQDHNVALWTRNAEDCAHMTQSRENQRYLPGFAFPEKLSVAPSLTQACAEADLILIATSVAGLRPTLAALQAHGLAHKPIITACKGFEEGSGLLPHEVILDVCPEHPAYGALSGPSFAQELAQGLPCAVTLASPNEAWITHVAQLLNNHTLRLYANTDIIGAAIGGAVKNVMAIATGIADGLHYGLNARAALMTRGLAEINRFAIASGAQNTTLMGLAGMGDLILTCTGNLSRNRTVGLKLAEDKSLATILAELGHVAEGVKTTKEVARVAKARNIDMPITAIINQLLDGQIKAKAVAEILMMRDPKQED
ncbi:MAG: NAD(P)-dependent glycerol-3-phosphate dehydrogenase [Neisseriaceae bacterium]|nr:NAD(P)-dependent glycerol-3-phosphate dehydrogenase [Neisseriaceae bacterium]